MTLIEAIIQPYRFDAVKAALSDLGIDGMTVMDVMGHGRQRGHAEVYRGEEYRVEFRPKIKIEMIVHDCDTSRVVGAICVAARTGRIGDGKVFLSRVSEAVRIRNGEIDEAAL